MKNEHSTKQVNEISNDIMTARARLASLRMRTMDQTECEQLAEAQNALTKAMRIIAKLNNA